MQADAPTVGPCIRAFGPVSNTSADTDFLIANAGQFGHECIDRDRPLVAFPVIGSFGVQNVTPGIGSGVSKKGLEEGGTGFRRRRSFIAAPDMVGQRPIGPAALGIETNRSWTGPPLVLHHRLRLAIAMPDQHPRSGRQMWVQPGR